MSNSINDIAGKTFNQIRVLSFSHMKDNQSYWNCQCECGNYFTSRRCGIIKGMKSCLKCKNTREKYYDWKGCGLISGTLWSHIKYGAKQRGIKFSLSIKDAIKVFEKQNGLCALSGVKIDLPQSAKDFNCGNRSASLDRKDSTKGYTIGNVQWVHKTINQMKWSSKQDDFINWCCAVAKHSKKRKNNYAMSK